MRASSAMNEIDSGAASSTTMLVGERHIISSVDTPSPHPFENIEKQEDDSEASVPEDDFDYDNESWGFLLVEALLYIPMLLQSLFTSMHLARSLLWGEAVMLFLEQRSLHAPWWWQRCQSFFVKIDSSNVWPPPSFLLLVALTVIALVVHPDGFTWVLLGKTRKGALSLAEMTSMWWDIFINEHGAIVSSFLALATFAALFFLAYVLKKSLSPRSKSPAMSEMKNISGKLKKKKRKGGSTRANHRLGRNKSSSEIHDRADKSLKGEEKSTDSSLRQPMQQSPQKANPHKGSDDNLPVYATTTHSPNTEVPENGAHPIVSPVSDVSVVSRERSFSGSTTESCETVESRTTAYQSSDGATFSTNKAGHRAYFATHTNHQQAVRKKNARRGTIRKVGSNDSHPKQIYDVLNHSPARLGSQRDSSKPYTATFHRVQEKQGSKASVSPRYSSTKPHNSSNRSSVINRSQNDQIKPSPRMTPSRDHARGNVISSDYGSTSSNATQSSRFVSTQPVSHYPYHNAGNSFSHFNNNHPALAFSGSTQHLPNANAIEGTRDRHRAPNLSSIPAPPGFSHPMSLPTSAAVAMPASLPMVSSSVQSPPLSLDLCKTDLQEIRTTNRCPVVKENPFESSAIMMNSVLDQNEEDRIDAELQELGGRMVGSILDF